MPDRLDVPTTDAPTGGDWPAQATDAIVNAVGTVHNNVTEPAYTVARAVVYGVFAAILGTAALVVTTILMFDLLDDYLPDAWFGEQHVWASYLIVGTLFCVAALILWSYREPKTPEG
jgi:hypothetical protein